MVAVRMRRLVRLLDRALLSAMMGIALAMVERRLRSRGPRRPARAAPSRARRGAG